MYEQLSAQLSRPQKVTFVKVNVDEQKEIASNYQVTAYVSYLTKALTENAESDDG